MKPDKHQAPIVSSDPFKNKMIIAGPGSGKTTVMVLCYLELIKQGVDPNTICVVTFSNNAANEIRERIEKKVTLPSTASAKICTIHGFCNRTLKSIWDSRGIPHREMWNRAIHLGRIENPQYFLSSVIEKTMDKHRLFGDFRPTLADLEKYITYRYSRLQYDHSIIESDFGPEIAKAMHDVFVEYSKFLKENRLITFQTMLAHVEQWMIRNKAVRSMLQAQNEIVISDESQDLFPQASRIITTISQDAGWNKIYHGITPAR